MTCVPRLSLQPGQGAEAELWRRHPQRSAHGQEEALEQHRGEAHPPGERAARLSHQADPGREGEVRLDPTGLGSRLAG